ncbi:MAG: circadian clock protein KaiC [Steroidobacteraceae bacterium]
MSDTVQTASSATRSVGAQIGTDVIARKNSMPRTLPKIPTGVPGFDELSHGGLPRNRTSLVMGGPGTGKTVFALQTLVKAARGRRQAGIFIAFEERVEEIFANAAAFDWRLTELSPKKIFFLDASLSPAVVHSGDFELTGLLAILEAKKKQLGATWIVFDGIDVLLSLLRNRDAEMRELYRVRDWLARNALTAIITTKVNGDMAGAVSYGFMQFMVDCVIRLDRRLEQGVAVRRLEVTKYRGSDFAPGEFPLNFGPDGVQLAAPRPDDARSAASSERMSTGFKGLDSMLGGGVFRGSTTLITGAPGTSKTTLAGQFASSACGRGERTLYVSFDEGGERIRRNLTSVGVHLGRHVKSGLLRMYSGRADVTNPEEQLARIGKLILQHQPRCMVIDPLSAIARTGALSSARAIVNRLIYEVQDHKITAVFTSLVDGTDLQDEGTELQISTIADTWIHLSYLVRGGERNRALTIVKSRGTRHSNQVRELVLSESGPALTDVYSSGGEVLMGTLRWEKEAAEKARKLERRAEFQHTRSELQFAEADIAARMAALQLDLDKQRKELELYTFDDEARQVAQSEGESRSREKRADATAPPTAPGPVRKRAARISGMNGEKARQRGT